MSNDEFLSKLQELIEDNMVILGTKAPKDYFVLKEGKINFSIHRNFADFADVIKSKIENKQFFNQSMIERLLDRSGSYVDGMVYRGELTRIILNGHKFYLKDNE